MTPSFFQKRSISVRSATMVPRYPEIYRLRLARLTATPCMTSAVIIPSASWNMDRVGPLFVEQTAMQNVATAMSLIILEIQAPHTTRIMLEALQITTWFPIPSRACGGWNLPVPHSGLHPPPLPNKRRLGWEAKRNIRFALSAILIMPFRIVMA